MCLDPRPESLFAVRRPLHLQSARPARARHPHASPFLAKPAPAAEQAPPLVAAEDELAARGWVLLSRGA